MVSWLGVASCPARFATCARLKRKKHQPFQHEVLTCKHSPETCLHEALLDLQSIPAFQGLLGDDAPSEEVSCGIQQLCNAVGIRPAPMQAALQAGQRAQLATLHNLILSYFLALRAGRLVALLAARLQP